MPHTNADHHPRLPSFSIQGATFIVMVGSMFLFETLQMIFLPTNDRLARRRGNRFV